MHYFRTIFERELALLVALHVASIWRVDSDTVSRQKLGKSVWAPAAKARCFKSEDIVNGGRLIRGHP